MEKRNYKMRKVLLILPFSSTFYAPIRKAFEFYGFEVFHVDYRGNFTINPDSMFHRLSKIMPKYGYFKRNAKRAINKKILEKAEEIRPDLVFASKAPNLYPDTVIFLSKICPTVNYYCETMDQWELIKKIAPNYNYFVNLDPYVVEMLKKEGYKNAIYIPFSSDLSDNDQWVKPQKYLYNISFIGTYDKKLYSEREDILK